MHAFIRKRVKLKRTLLDDQERERERGPLSGEREFVVVGGREDDSDK